MNEDIIDIEITEDGLIKSTTPKISAANHANSTEFFKMLARLTGGSTNYTKRNKFSGTHTHANGTTHDHNTLKGSN